MLSAGHPVVRLDFSGGGFEEPGPLQKDAIAQLDVLAEESRVAVHGDAAPIRFSNLIRALRRKTGHRVVAPADEYDTPILDALEGPGTGAREPRLPARPPRRHQVRETSGFTRLTGVSRFSKVSLFSGGEQSVGHQIGTCSNLCGICRGQ